MNWIDTKEAARLLSAHNSREITAAYVRTLVAKNMIEGKSSEDGKSLLVKKKDVEKRTVHTRSGRRVENLARDRRSGRPGGRPRKAAKEQENV